MNTSAGNSRIPSRHVRLSVDELIRAKQSRPVRSLADIDVASLIIKKRLPPPLATKLIDTQPVLTFVTRA
ncbi:hypothetical protein [Paractinoplanes atraurantiacus]|uniref:Uncharacterized protein n=1 Tax=Paractinoplanes atraurantiacus TaxID=1036182 RepID=A0A285IPG5_9ACTN|nr:hypothetical protein [Actinoplanes atraurantiacus]SNY49910.1 hypothetical protein SAMN05421748_110165 [Actinoplanes atraurantiacus]